MLFRSLNNRFVIYSTPGNAVICLDYVTANSAATITKEKGGLMAISTDPFTKEKRTLFYENCADGTVADGKVFVNIASDWLNIDGQLGFVAAGNKAMGFGDQANNNSILTSRLYTLYSDESRQVNAGDVVGRRNVNYYTSVDADVTRAMRDRTVLLADRLPEGWNGVIVPDPDGTYYLLLSNFNSMSAATLEGISVDGAAPVFSVPAVISDNASTAEFIEQLNNSHADVLNVFVKGTALRAVLASGEPDAAYITNESTAEAAPTVTFIASGKPVTAAVTIGAGASVKVYLDGGVIKSEKANFPQAGGDELTAGYTDVRPSV